MLVFDIETGPLEWEAIEGFFSAPDAPGDFDPGAVKYGNTKDPAKRAEKLAQAQSDHAALVAGHGEVIEQAKRDFAGGAALSPLTGRVVAIGYKSDREEVVVGLGRKKKAEDGLVDIDEALVLGDFWRRVENARREARSMVGHNIFGFDLPFLLRRSWKNDVAVPEGVLSGGRYWDKCFVDTMQQWCCGAYGERVSLDNLAKFFGVGGKPDGITGADFARLWFGTKEERVAADGYLRNDLQMTYAVAQCMGIV